MHDLSAWTWIWGANAALWFFIALWTGRLRNIAYTAIMLSAWMVATLAYTFLDADVAIAPVAGFDAAVGLVIAWSLVDDPNPWGKAIVGLFALEMIVRVGAWHLGLWDSFVCYGMLNAIGGAQSALLGGPGALEAIRHWRHRIFDRAVPARPDP